MVGNVEGRGIIYAIGVGSFILMERPLFAPWDKNGLTGSFEGPRDIPGIPGSGSCHFESKTMTPKILFPPKYY